jgi:hypothetical protein
LTSLAHGCLGYVLCCRSLGQRWLGTPLSGRAATRAIRWAAVFNRHAGRRRHTDPQPNAPGAALGGSLPAFATVEQSWCRVVRVTETGRHAMRAPRSAQAHLAQRRAANNTSCASAACAMPVSAAPPLQPAQASLAPDLAGWCQPQVEHAAPKASLRVQPGLLRNSRGVSWD